MIQSGSPGSQPLYGSRKPQQGRCPIPIRPGFGYANAKMLPAPYNSHYLDESMQALSIVNLAYEHGGIALIAYLDTVREARSVGVNALSGYAQTWLAVHQLSFTPRRRSFHNTWALLIILNVARAPIGGLLALLITHTNFSVSSGVGFLALFGVSVQTGVIMLEYINQLRVQGNSIEDAAIAGAVLRLRPIIMTMLVATLGLLPAAMSHGIGSDSQRPFAIVIVGGLIGALAINVFLLPTVYAWIAPETEFAN